MWAYGKLTLPPLGPKAASPLREIATNQPSEFAYLGFGMVALHAAAVGTRMTRLIAENTLVWYRTALDAPLHRNLSEITIRRHYDVTDSLEAIAPREVTLLNPADALGQAMHLEQTHERLSATTQSEQNLGYKDRIRLVRRSAHDPFPTE